MAYSVGMQSTATANAEPKQSSVFHTVSLVHDQVGELVKRIYGLADRLVGAVPEAVSNKTDMPASGSVFGALGASAAAVGAQINRAHDALNRIENSLP